MMLCWTQWLVCKSGTSDPHSGLKAEGKGKDGKVLEDEIVTLWRLTLNCSWRLLHIPVTLPGGALIAVRLKAPLVCCSG